VGLIFATTHMRSGMPTSTSTTKQGHQQTVVNPLNMFMISLSSKHYTFRRWFLERHKDAMYRFQITIQ